MKCAEIDVLLDQLMDGELNDKQLRVLDEHGRECPDCAARIRATRQMKALFEDMEPEADVPLAAQAAWRGAVRAEARAVQRKKLYRRIGAAAAAVVVLVGAGLSLNGKIAPSTNSKSAKLDAMEMVEESAEQPRFASANSAVVDTDGSDAGIMEDSAVPPMEAAFEAEEVSMNAASGEIAEGEAAAAVTNSAPMREITLHVKQIDAACSAIEDLVSEYEGTLDTQRMEGGGANLYVELPSDNLSDFVSAIAYLDVSGQLPEVSEDTGAEMSALLLALEEE